MKRAFRYSLCVAALGGVSLSLAALTDGQEVRGRATEALARK
jgi:hypothetical protein